MSWPPETPPVVVYVQDKPVLYLHNGTQVTVQRPVGFAGHPSVPPLRKKP